MDTKTIESLESVIRRDGRYPPEAYEFLQQGLVRAAEQLHGPHRGKSPRHVSGPDLCYALRDLARDRWGPLADTVLRRWNITSTRDFGTMVYFFVDLGLFGVQASDSIEDFEDVFDFTEAFGKYQILTTPEPPTED